MCSSDLANSRLPFYLLPLFPAMALLTAIRWPFKDSVKLYAHSPSWLTLNRSFVVIALIVTSLLSLKVAGAYYSSHENMRIFYNVLKTSVPSNTCEIVSVNEHMEGLSLYFPGEVERVTTGRRTYPFFTKPESLEEEISEILQEPATHVLVGKRGEDRKTIQKELEVAGIPYRVLDLPFQHYIFICYPENQALSSLSPSL